MIPVIMTMTTCNGSKYKGFNPLTQAYAIIILSN